MSFKSDKQTLSFSDLELSQKKAKNNTLKQLQNIKRHIQWEPIESTLVKSYPVGKQKKGPQAYSPLMLFKCLLLRNWFQIKSDVDLECLINDRFSFKKFVGLPVDASAPDSSTFSRFRKRLTPKKYRMILSDVSDQLSSRNLILNMGTAADLRVMKSKKRTS